MLTKFCLENGRKEEKKTFRLQLPKRAEGIKMNPLREDETEKVARVWIGGDEGKKSQFF